MRRTKEEAAKTREDVLAAAALVFYDNGVSRSSLEEIARRAGVTRGAIYWHFKDKAEVLTALQAQIRFPQEAIISKALEQHGPDDPLSIIESGAISVLNLLAKDEHQQRIYAIITLGCEVSEETSDALSRIVSANRDMYEKLMEKMSLAEERGLLASGWTAEIAARAFQCSMNGLLAEWLRSNKVFGLVEVGERIVKGLIQSMRRGPDPARHS